MTLQQFKQMRELLEEAIRLSPSADFDSRVTRFLNSLESFPETSAQPVPVVICDVIGSVQPIFGPRTNPLDDWIGGPA